MCRRVTCNSCAKPTFAGCGAHIEQVLGDVPKAERCRCREQGKKEKPRIDIGSARSSFLSRFLGK